MGGIGTELGVLMINCADSILRMIETHDYTRDVYMSCGLQEDDWKVSLIFDLIYKLPVLGGKVQR